MSLLGCNFGYIIFFQLLVWTLHLCYILSIPCADNEEIIDKYVRWYATMAENAVLQVRFDCTYNFFFFPSVWSSLLKNDHMSAPLSSLPMPCADSRHGSVIWPLVDSQLSDSWQSNFHPCWLLDRWTIDSKGSHISRPWFKLKTIILSS